MKANQRAPLHTVQAKAWKDKKLVGFLHNHLAEDTSDHTAKQWLPRKKWKKSIPRHGVTADCSHHMNGVDHKDRDTADWTVSLKSNRFYMRIFYWLFDGVLHAMYTIIKVVGRDTAHPWHKYLNKHLGRYKFQMDLANDLISHGISMDWLDIEAAVKILCHAAATNVSFARKDLPMASTKRRKGDKCHDHLSGQSVPPNRQRWENK